MSYREDLIAPDMKRFIKGMNILDESKITSFAEQSRKQFKIITPTIFQKLETYQVVISRKYCYLCG